MIKDFTPRLYQETILATCAQKNTLVVLPTGLGKTNIFLMLAAQRLSQFPKSKILLLGPTRPLIDQYFEVFRKHFDIDESDMAVFTGHVAPATRKELWEKSRIVFSTPQGLENDIISKRISLDDVSLLGFDEAHKAVKEYSYVWIAKHYYTNAKYPRILALTASPGSDLEKISEVCKNLFIEDIESRTEVDPDVKPYVKDIDIKWEYVYLSENLMRIRAYLINCLRERLRKIKGYGFLRTADANAISRRDLISLQGQIQGKIAGGEADPSSWSAISLTAESMKVQHALELLESQGLTALLKYMEKMNADSASTKVKAVKNLVADINFKSSLYLVRKLHEEGVEHPKLEKIKRIIKEELKKDRKIMIFNQFRDNAKKIVDTVNEVDAAHARLFVGQMKKGETGLSQKKQKEMLEGFRNGEFNVLVSTSVGEEGLDIPSVDLVIFYEPVPSAIRTVQRRGRTGRQEKGRVIMLVTKGTRDEAYRWSSHHKEKRMFRTLEGLKRRLNLESVKQVQTKLVTEDVKIYVDDREKGGNIIRTIMDMGIDVELKRLETADYQLSRRVGVEYKTRKDFVNSIIDGRLLVQLQDLKRNYERPIVMVEGTDDIYSIRNIHPNAIRGMISTITVSYGIPIVYTKDQNETASMLAIIAKREHESGSRDYSAHGSKKPLSVKELQEYIVASLPGVGSTLARPLLEKFRTVRKIFKADEAELKEVELIGEKKAKSISEVLDKEY